MVYLTPFAQVFATDDCHWDRVSLKSAYVERCRSVLDQRKVKEIVGKSEYKGWKYDVINGYVVVKVKGQRSSTMEKINGPEVKLLCLDGSFTGSSLLFMTCPVIQGLVSIDHPVLVNLKVKQLERLQRDFDSGALTHHSLKLLDRLGSPLLTTFEKVKGALTDEEKLSVTLGIASPSIVVMADRVYRLGSCVKDGDTYVLYRRRFTDFRVVDRMLRLLGVKYRWM